MERSIVILPLVSGCDLWEKLAEYAETCSWSAGKYLAKQMRLNDFHDWERVFVVLINGCIAGYCTFAKTDCIPNVAYTPYIGYMFVGESYRGNHLSGKMIDYALGYARALGFQCVYLVSDQVNFYEKYGFNKIDEKPAPWDPDTMETIFVHTT